LRKIEYFGELSELEKKNSNDRFDESIRDKSRDEAGPPIKKNLVKHGRKSLVSNPVTKVPGEHRPSSTNTSNTDSPTSDNNHAERMIRNGALCC
jgi:hypothetical protein